MAEQRYLAELAVLSLQAPAGTEQTVLVAPPRDVDAGPEGAGAMMADTAGLPWLRPAGPDELSAAAARARRRPGRPRSTRPGSTRPGWPTSPRSVAVREDLAGAVVGRRRHGAARLRRRDLPDDVRRLAGRPRGLPGVPRRR